MKRRAMIGSVGVAVASLFAGCLGGGSNVPEETVTIKNDSFNPIRISIDSGTRIKWVNNDSYVHTVTADQFHDKATQWSFSKSVGQGDDITHRFEEAGIYEYKDRFRGKEKMCGVILVGDVSLDASLPCE